MQSARNHYATHLGPIYSWMLGGVDAALARGSAELDALGPRPDGMAIAVDLGAGFGMHAIPLARRGFSVLAFDTNAELLRELATYAKTLPIRSVDADLLTFRAHMESAAEVILADSTSQKRPVRAA